MAVPRPRRPNPPFEVSTRNRVPADTDVVKTKARLDLDALMHDLMLVGFVGLVGWSFVGAFGTFMGLLRVAPEASLRFLLAILVLVFSRRTYWELREWHWRKLSPEQRFGFSNPLREQPRASELSAQLGRVVTTGSSQAQG